MKKIILLILVLFSTCLHAQTLEVRNDTLFVNTPKLGYKIQIRSEGGGFDYASEPIQRKKTQEYVCTVGWSLIHKFELPKGRFQIELWKNMKLIKIIYYEN